jgi:hypothetical protein
MVVVIHKLLKDVMTALRGEQENHERKVADTSVWKTLIYVHYDFGSGLDFNIQQLKKGLTLFGPVSEKVSAGNDTGIHSLEKWIGKGNKCMFVCMSSSNETAPSEKWFLPWAVTYTF